MKIGIKRMVRRMTFFGSVVIMRLVILFGDGKILFSIDGSVIDRSLGY
jgi:hypothetical protein